MVLRPPRLLTSLLAGGLVTGSLLLGAGSAIAAPGSDDVVEARCGQTVRAEPGQQVKVIPALGAPIVREVTRGMDPITSLVGGVLCRVQVTVVEPVTTRVAEAAPPLREVTEDLSEGTGAALAPTTRPKASATPRSQAAPTATPAAAAAPTLTPQQAAAAAPAFAPAFGALPSSFLRSATGPAPGVAAYDPNMLLGSAFPGLRAGAPAYLGYDAASAVTTASQVQALPVDGLTDGGVGVPALIAVLVLSGVAAFAVRRIVLGAAGARAGAPAAPIAPANEAPEPPEADEPDDLADDLADDEALTVAAIAAPARVDDADELPTVAGRTPVPA
jgi:hypothetical protein